MAVRNQLAGWDERVLTKTRNDAAGPSLLLSLGVLVFGVVVGLAGILGSWRTLAPTLFTSSSVSLPAVVERHFDVGDYEVYQRTGARSGGPGLFGNESEPATIGPNDVVVVGPNGDTVPVEMVDSTESITRDAGTYTGTVWFHISRAGTYRVSIGANGGFAQAIVASTIGDAFRRAAAWLAITGLGGLVALTGLVLLVIGSTRRHRGVRPGWYADPGGSGRLRWWNGVAWTEHIW